MKNKSLSDLVDIILSNVDKKTSDNEIPVALCNFTDVYYNWDVNESDVPSFMKATATRKEIARFTIKAGDVLLTKDSETRDDIGMSCYVAGDLGGALLGYHCALLRPKSGAISGAYLNAYLQSPLARKYFSNQASGSGQRYTLSVEGIGAVKIPLPEVKTQEQIASFLQAITQKIRVNRLIISNLHDLILCVFNRWFNQFDFDQQRPGSEERQWTYNNVLKKDIPSGWEVASIAENPLCSFIDVGVPWFLTKNYLATANVSGTEITDGEYVSYENRESRANMQPTLNSVWFAKMKNSVKHVFISSRGQWMVDKYVFSTGFSALQCTDVSFPYVASVIMQPYFETTKDVLSHGATQQSVNNDDLISIPLLIPPKEVLEKYRAMVGPMFERMNEILRESQCLEKLRTRLLPLFMNGQISLN